MPQYADPSVLMQGRGIAVPDPMELASKGLTLAQLFQQQQIGQMGLERQRAVIDAMQDPRIMGMMFPGAGGAPQLGQLTPEDMKRLGPGLPDLAKMSLDIAEKRSKIGAETAAADKANRETLDATLKSIASQAAQFAQTRPTPESMQIIDFQLRRAGAIAPPMPSPMAASPQGISKWLADVSSFATDPNTLSQINERNTKLQPEVKKIGAQTSQIEEETRLAPVKVGIESYRATTERFKPEVKESALTGTMMGVAPWVMTYGGGSAPGGGGGAPAPQNNSGANGPAGANPPSVRPPAAPRETAAMGGEGRSVGTGVNSPTTPGITDTGVQTQPRPMQKQSIEAAGKELDDLTTRATTAGSMKAMVLDLRNQEANQGLYSGGLAGTDFFRRLANIFAPALSPDQQKILASTQAWDAQSKALVAEAVRQFAGARVAARELPFFEQTKPNELQTPKGRELVYRMLYNVSDRIQQAKLQADAWANDPAHPGRGLSGWVPQFKNTTMPPIMIQAPNGKEYPAANVEAAEAMLRDFASVGR